MTQAAAASGAANDVSAVTGPAMPPHLELAIKLTELTAAEERTERMRSKVAKSKQAAKDMNDTATAGLAQAVTEEKAARKAVDALIGEHGEEAVAALQAAADEARAQAEAAAELLRKKGD